MGRHMGRCLQSARSVHMLKGAGGKVHQGSPVQGKVHQGSSEQGAPRQLSAGQGALRQPSAGQGAPRQLSAGQGALRQLSAGQGALMQLQGLAGRGSWHNRHCQSKHIWPAATGSASYGQLCAGCSSGRARHCAGGRGH